MRISLTRMIASLTIVLLAGISPLRAQNADSKADWDRTVAAAKKEGSLIISAPPGTIWRDQILLFAKDYPEIKLDVTPISSRDYWPRVVKEREVTQYLWDIRIGGMDTLTYKLKQQGVFIPVRPLLMLPEVKDETKWMGGIDALFLDSEKTYFPAYIANDTQTLYYSTKHIAEAKAPTMQTLIEPQWSGKISMADPRGGSSLNVLSVMMKVYGEDFVRKLMVDQKPVITQDPRQQITWLTSGRYPITFGVPNAALVEYEEKGGAVADFKKLDGLRMWSPGTGGMQLLANAPHPNATTVFVNWFLSRDVQARLAQAVKLNSRRTDVALGAPDQALDASRMSEYVGTQGEDIEPYAFRVTEMLREVVK